VKPGAPGDGQAPHLNVIVLARGMLTHAFTRIYFADEAGSNAADRFSPWSRRTGATP